MAIRILTKNSVDNTNIDGARQNHFNAGMRSGVVKGALNECNVTSPASNQIVINTGELRISGHQIIIEESEQLQLTNTPQTATDYSIIAEISVDDLSIPAFRMFIQPQSSGLAQDNLFISINGVGTYQIKLANFTQNTDGSIFNLERVADLISGITKEQIESAIDVASNALSQSSTALSNSNSAINIANSADTMAESAVATANNAETKADNAVSVANNANVIAGQANNIADEALRQVVSGLGTKVYVGEELQSSVNFTGDPQAQINSKQPNIRHIELSFTVILPTGTLTEEQFNTLLADDNNLIYNTSLNLYLRLTKRTSSQWVYAGGNELQSDWVVTIDTSTRKYTATQQYWVDVITETWKSSDGKTWYRKWQSGWKECGGIFSGAGGGWKTYNLPVTFGTSNYIITTTVLANTENDATLTAPIRSKTTTSFRYTVTYMQVGNGTYASEDAMFYCCGY